MSVATTTRDRIRRTWQAIDWRSIWGEAGIYLIAIVVALVVNSVFILIVRGNILVAYRTILQVSLGNPVGFAQTLNKWTPLLLGSLAVALGIRGGVFNIGVDGQIYAGAIMATGTAFLLAPLRLPALALVPIVVLAGALGGGLWAGIAGALKARYAVNEIFVTVMLNSIALYLTQYLAAGPWNDPVAGEAITLQIPRAAFFPMLLKQGGGHAGILVAVLLVLGLYLLLEKTVLGYNIKAMGDNAQAARVGGINCGLMAFLILSLSGLLAGLAGAIEVTGVHHRLILGLSPAYGAMSILIANVGKASPIGALLSSFFFAVLFVGSDSLQRSVGLPASAVLVFQAVMFLSILVARCYRELKVR